MTNSINNIKDKDSKWYLTRLGPIKDVYRLKYGENILGRAESSDFVVHSVYSSRKHCSITVNEKSVTLQDYAINGTFVNKKNYRGKSVSLYENDSIGIGCTTDAYQQTDYNVYRLKRDNDPDDQVVEIDDDECTNFNFSIKEEIKQEAIDNDEFCLNLEESFHIKSEVPIEYDEIIELSDDDDNIIEPHVKPDENETTNDLNNSKKSINPDESIVIDDDDDEDDEEDIKVRNWILKLSQNVSQSVDVENEIQELDEETFFDKPKDKKKESLTPDDQSNKLISIDNIEPEPKEIDEIDQIKEKSPEKKSDIIPLKTLKVRLEKFDLKSRTDKSKTKDDKKHKKKDRLKKEKKKDDHKEVRNERRVSKDKKSKSKSSSPPKTLSDCRSSVNRDVKNDCEEERNNKIKIGTKRTRNISSDSDEEFRSKKTGQWFSKNNKVLPCASLIEPHSIPPNRTLAHGFSKEVHDKKRHSEIVNKKARTIATEKCTKYMDEMKKKFKQVTPAKVISRKDREKRDEIKETRKQKLKDLAESRTSVSKSMDDEPRVLNLPKVKVTESNRGAFLTDNLPKIIPKRRNSRSATLLMKSQINGDDSREEIHKETNKEINKAIQKEPPAQPKILIEDKNFMKENDLIIRTGPRKRISRALSINEVKENNTATTVREILPVHVVVPEPRPILKPLNFKSNKKKMVTFNMKIDIKYVEILDCDRPLLKPSQSLMKECLLSARLKNAHEMIEKNKHINISIEESPGLKKQISQPQKQPQQQQIKPVIISNKATTSKQPEKPRIQLAVNRNPDLHPYQNILSDILSWNPEWINKDLTKIIPKIIGNVPLLPMIHIFSSFDEYLRILIPLMKIELWESIRACPVVKKYFLANIRHCVLGLQKGDGLRNIHTAQCINECNKELRPGMLIIIKYDEKNQFYGYCTNKECVRVGDKIHIYITFETRYSPMTNSLKNGMNIHISMLTYIKTEVAGFEATIDINNSPLKDYFLNPTSIPKVIMDTTLENYKNEALNEIQSKVLINTYNQCLKRNKPNIVLIEGPPGTGKSHLIAQLVTQLIYGSDEPKFRVLICSASNAAIDTILEKLDNLRNFHKKLGKRGIKMIRFGVREKMSVRAKAYSVDTLTETNMQHFKKINTTQTGITDETRRGYIIEKELLEGKIRILNIQENPSEMVLEEIRTYKEEIRRLDNILNGGHVDEKLLHKQEQKTENDIVVKAEVVCTTLTSCFNLMRFVRKYDICIVDEATQCTEPFTSIPLQFGIKTLILVGDSKQLPATVISQCANAHGLSKSLFSRIQNSFILPEKSPVILLDTQYRMHPEICQFPNKYFYNGRLKTDPSTTNSEFPLKPYSIIQLEFFQEYLQQQQQNPQQKSVQPYTQHIINEEEAQFIASLIQGIEVILQKKYKIGVITPYQLQKQTILIQLRKLNIDYVNVNTIDSYQGQEKDIIILSTARTKGVGFLNNPQRLNVALTRAKHSLIICGNFISLRNIPMWKSLLDDAAERNLIYNFTTDSEINSIIDIIKK